VKLGATCWGLLAPLLLLCCAAKHPASGNEPYLPGHKGIQLERGLQNHLVVSGQVNNQPATFIIDTASAITFLRGDSAGRLGVVASGGDYAIAPGKSLPRASVNLQAGTMDFGKVMIGLADPAQHAGNLPADGSIGLDLLRRYKAVINCRTKQIFFKTAASSMDLAATTTAQGFARIPIREDRNGYLMVACSLGGKSGRMMVDTGAFATIMNETALRYRGVTGENSNLTAANFDGKVQRLRVATIDNLKIGPLSIAPRELAMMNLTGEAGRRKGLRMGYSYVEATARRDSGGEIFFGLLGNDLLDHLHAIIDLESMNLFLK
jgi:predicted aspartyl protease